MCSGRYSKKAFSFLEGVNPDIVSLTETEEKVTDMVSSQSSGLIYVVYEFFVSAFKWDEKKKTFRKQFKISIEDKEISSITLAPPDTSGGDQIYVSVGFQDETKYVYRVSGRELEKRVPLVDTSYIDDECFWWVLASNSDRHILLIHPTMTPFIYIHLKEQKHGKVDLNELNIPNSPWFERIELIGQLILGEYFYKICMCELIVTEGDAFIKPGSERGPIESYRGHFAALSHAVGDEDEQLHLFTVRYKNRHCVDISEYKFSLSVSGSEFNQLPIQPIHTLRVKGKLYPRCLVNVNSFYSVLIGFADNISAVELLKLQVKQHVQQSSS